VSKMANHARKIDVPMADLSPAQLARAKRGPGHGFRAKPLTLASLRRARNLTQAEVAEASGLKQGDVSRLEARTDLDGVRVGTLRRYLEALGGGLELIAELSDRHRIPVVGVTKER
jgi:hypothetical protein